MYFSTVSIGRDEAIADLFNATFSASEKPAEGTLISGFVHGQMADTAPGHLCVFAARDKGAVIGGADFSRLTCAYDPRAVFLVSAMAVATGRQGVGIGRALLCHAQANLHEQGVHGDPAFHGEVGFMPIIDTGDFVGPVCITNTHPVGMVNHAATRWMIDRCAAAFHKRHLWAMQVVSDTHDGVLNDINGQHITADHARGSGCGQRWAGRQGRRRRRCRHDLP